MTGGGIYDGGILFCGGWEEIVSKLRGGGEGAGGGGLCCLKGFEDTWGAAWGAGGKGRTIVSVQAVIEPRGGFFISSQADMGNCFGSPLVWFHTP